jgi:hypothetical protein
MQGVDIADSDFGAGAESELETDLGSLSREDDSDPDNLSEPSESDKDDRPLKRMKQAKLTKSTRAPKKKPTTTQPMTIKVPPLQQNKKISNHKRRSGIVTIVQYPNFPTLCSITHFIFFSVPIRRAGLIKTMIAKTWTSQ